MLALGLPESDAASKSLVPDAKAIATLSYLHNGKLDLPPVLGYMQDPELHGLIYGRQQPNPDITVYGCRNRQQALVKTVKSSEPSSGRSGSEDIPQLGDASP